MTRPEPAAAPRRTAAGWLQASSAPLTEQYDVAMLDLDGVVYVGVDAVPGAARHLAAATAAGMHIGYVTNSASRPPGAIAAHLRQLGVDAAEEDVVTSAQAAARLLSEWIGQGAVYVIGGEGLFSALTELGLEPTQSVDDHPIAVASGYHAELRWKTVADGAILVRHGLPWVASNTDLTVPTPQGPGPGSGVLVRAVAEYAQVQPVVAGKPQPALFEETLRRVGGRRPLVVGDRLDTDIEGGYNSGYESLLVMTGVTDAAELVSATRERRPTYISADLGGLHTLHRSPVADGAGWTLAAWRARVDEGRLSVAGSGSVDDWWRVVAAAAWDHLDRTGDAVDTGRLSTPKRE